MKAMLDGSVSSLPNPPMASGTMNSNTPDIESQNCRRRVWGTEVQTDGAWQQIINRTEHRHGEEP